MRKRRISQLPAPQGWGEDQLSRRAAKATEVMRKFDLMPPEFRELANHHGMKVRAMMRDGATAEQVKRQFPKPL